MKQRLIKISAYGLGYLFMTVLFVYMTFPTEAARDVLERTARYKAGIWTEIGDLSLDGLSGVTLEDIYVQLNPKAPLGEELLSEKERKKEHRQISLKIDNLSIDADLLDMASHSPSDPIRYSLEAELFGGTFKIREHYIPEARSKDPQELKGLEISDVDLRKTRLLRAILPLNIEGVLQVNADLKHRPNGPPQSGTLTISIEKALLKSFVAPINDPNLNAMRINKIHPTDADLGTIQIEATIGEPKRGRRGNRRGAARGNTMLTFKRFEVSGGEIEVLQDGQGLIQWTSDSAPLSSGRINLQLGIKVSEDFINKEVTENGDTNKPNLMIGLAQNVREVKQAMRGDWIGIHITGTLGNPTIRKRRPSARIQRPIQSAPQARPAAKRPPRKPRAKPARRGIKNSDMGAQRKARQDRLQKRREELKRRREERAREREREPEAPKPSLRDRNRGRRGANNPLGGGRYDSPGTRPDPLRSDEPDEQEEEEELETEDEDFVEEESDDEDLDENSDENLDEDSDEEEEEEEEQTFDEEEEID